MGVIEIHCTRTPQSLRRKSKDWLVDELLATLEFCEKKETKRAEYQYVLQGYVDLQAAGCPVEAHEHIMENCHRLRITARPVG